MDGTRYHVLNTNARPVCVRFRNPRLRELQVISLHYDLFIGNFLQNQTNVLLYPMTIDVTIVMRISERYDFSVFRTEVCIFYVMI